MKQHHDHCKMQSYRVDVRKRFTDGTLIVSVHCISCGLGQGVFIVKLGEDGLPQIIPEVRQ